MAATPLPMALTTLGRYTHAQINHFHGVVMGLQDRDYYKAEVRKRHTSNVFETANRIKHGGNTSTHHLSPVLFTGWVSVLLRTIVICLAVYGALALVRDFRTGLWPWMHVDSAKVQRLLPYLSSN